MRAWRGGDPRPEARQIPNWLVRLVALFDKDKRHVLPLIGDVRSATSAKAERVLGWRPRSREDAIVATAESLLKFGIVRRAGRDRRLFDMSTVLVTGGSGFVGSHVILQLLNAGHTVRTTVRSLTREDSVRAMLRDAGADAGARLSFFAADLVRDEGWAEAVAGCDYVIHVASPIPIAAPKTEDELIVPARDGVLRVLKAARDATVKRVVFTSTCGAIYYGHPPQTAPFDETSWTNINGGEMSAYVQIEGDRRARRVGLHDRPRAERSSSRWSTRPASSDRCSVRTSRRRLSW